MIILRRNGAHVTLCARCARRLIELSTLARSLAKQADRDDVHIVWRPQLHASSAHTPAERWDATETSKTQFDGMAEAIEKEQAKDTALASMVLLLSFLDRPADESQLRHLLGKGSEPATADDLVRLARKLDVRARKVSVGKRRLDDMPLPAVAVMRDGTHLVLVQASAEKSAAVSARAGASAGGESARFRSGIRRLAGSDDDA